MEIIYSHLILDACCILNLCASGEFLGILKSLPAEIVVTTIVQEKELITLQNFPDFAAAIQQGLLKVVDFESEDEEESFVNYTDIVDDGEAATFAIAVHRNWAIATDDKKAIAFIKKEAPNIQILSTAEIIKHWSESESIDNSILFNVLNAIRIKGHFVPSKNDPLRNWWQGIIT
ncbi:MAG: hypothetical protein F6K61_11260 [Sphaerospermopsis sp. SIO1G1]|nr:hypothetical protein [Sphaerospermopsis sp. SIO1G1]